MRKIIKVVVLAALTGSVAWAQIPPLPSLPPPPLPIDLGAGFPNSVDNIAFQADPKSPVSDVSGRFGTAVDDFVGVTSWSGIEFDSMYFFLGGVAGVNGTGVQGGFATRLAGNYLALYYNGNLANGGGYDNGASNSDLKSVQGQLDWDNNIAFLFGSEAIGGVRLDLLINGTSLNTETGGNAGSKEAWWGSGRQLTTTLQWGKPLGSLTPSVMLGFIWPETYTVEPNSGGGKVGMWEGATLGFTVGADIGDLNIENHLVVGFGTTTKSDAGTATMSGSVSDRLRVSYGVTLDLTEKFQFKLKPRLTLRFLGADNKYTPPVGDAYNVMAPMFWFAVSPDVELALKYQRSERLAFYTGLSFRLLQFTARFDSSYKDQTQNTIDDKPVTWRFEGISFGNIAGGTNLQIAATFKFNDALSLEASLGTDLLSLGIPGTNGAEFGLNNPFDPQTVPQWITAGSLVFNVKF